MHSQWYVVVTKPKQERRALEHLEQQGGEVFLPMFYRERIQHGSISIVHEPLFPGYLFLNVPPNSNVLAKVRSTLGVRQLLRFGADPVTVDPCLIRDLRLRCELEVGSPIYKAGQKVKISSGPFQQYDALFGQYQGADRAIILLTLLGQQTQLVMDLSEFTVHDC